MDKVVIDTSILISALIGKTGPSREILRQCLLGQLTPLISNTLFLEYEAIQHRPNIADLCPLTNDEKKRLFMAYYHVCQWTQIHYLWRPNIKDEAENFLIELAVAGNARYLITNNIRDFQHAELTFPDLKIITPENLLQTLPRK